MVSTMPDETKTCDGCRWTFLSIHKYPCYNCTRAGCRSDHFEPAAPVDDTAKEDEDGKENA